MAENAGKSGAERTPPTGTREFPADRRVGVLSSGRLLRWYGSRRKASDLPGVAWWLVSSPSLALRAAGKTARLATSKFQRRESSRVPDFSVLGPDEIETGRLILKPLAEEDLDPLVQIFPSGQVGQRWPGKSPTPTWWDELGFISDLANIAFSWAIKRKSDGRSIGVCALGWYAVEGFEGAELGYWIRAGDRQAGYATEAANAVLDRCGCRMGLERVASFIAPENHASVRVAEKIGLRFQQQLVFRGGATHLYATADPES